MIPDGKVASGCLLVILLSFGSCSARQSPLSLAPLAPTAPLFRPEPNTAQHLRALAREQEAQLAACSDDNACASLHFTRALVALFENRSLAKTHFQQVVAIAPNGPITSSSTVWLDFLQHKPRDFAPAHPLKRATEYMVQDPRGESVVAFERLMRVTEHMVQDLLEQEAKNQQLTKELKASSAQALQHTLKAQEQTIKELTKQLDALKRIDQEMNEKTRRALQGTR